MNKLELIAALVAGLVFSLPATAKLYKWVDDQGVTHYGETIPPQYAGKERSELKSGRAIKKEEALTPEEQRAKEEADARMLAEKKAAQEQKRRDNALINTYSNEKEIELARTRNLQQVDARINGINSQIAIIESNLETLQKEADGYDAEGKKIPTSLQQDLNNSQKRLDKLRLELEKAQAEKAALNARYDADKARYKALTGR